MATATTAVTPATTTAPTLALPYKSNYEIAISFFKEKAKDLAKAINYGFGWAAQVYPNNPTLPSVSKGAKDVKNYLSIVEIPEKTDKTVASVRKFFEKPSVTTGRAVLKEATGFTNALCDGVDFSNNWLQMPSHVMKGLGLVNSGATILGCGNSAIEQAESIHCEIKKKWEEKKFNGPLIPLNLIRIARDVSYIAVAVLGIIAVGFGAAIAPWAFLACLTSALVFSIGEFFYANIVDPEGKNYDKEKRIAQLESRPA